MDILWLITTLVTTAPALPALAVPDTGLLARTVRQPVAHYTNVAGAQWDPVAPRIVYDSTVARLLGARVMTFVFAHEEAHVALRHTRRNVFGRVVATPAARTHAYEADADCLAVVRLAPTHLDAIEAAYHLFLLLGDDASDVAHPPATTRAARLLTCLPAAVRDSVTRAWTAPTRTAVRTEVDARVLAVARHRARQRTGELAATSPADARGVRRVTER